MKAEDELRRLLDINLASLGFRLAEFDITTTTTFGYMVRILSYCPCGGGTYACMMLDDYDFDPKAAAYDILSGMCGRDHLEHDQRVGTLPPGNIDHHIFKTLLTK